MKPPGQQRQAQLAQDKDTVIAIYRRACEQFGKEAVDRDHTRIWDMRCYMGIQRIIPFGSMASQNMRELLWVAESVCNLTQSAEAR